MESLLITQHLKAGNNHIAINLIEKSSPDLKNTMLKSIDFLLKRSRKLNSTDLRILKLKKNLIKTRLA